jgi:hypothetical protein
MANYYCSSRTNYFRVRDEKAFTAWAEKRELKVVVNPERVGEFVLLPTSEEGSFPNYDNETEEEFDFAQELAEHLAKDSVAVIMEAGAEKLRYIAGTAIAVNAKGETILLSLDDIYALAAAQFGVTPTRAEY